MSAGLYEEDPIREVTGLRAQEILERCRMLRIERHAGSAAPITSFAIAPADGEVRSPDRWRSVDLGMVTDVEFVRAAHLALLGRSPYDTEVFRRTGDLRAGKTRMEIILRLVFSPEGRGDAAPRVAGLLLPALVWLARRAGRAERTLGRRR